MAMTKIDRFCAFTPLKVLGICLIFSFVAFIIVSIVLPSHPTQHGEASMANIMIGSAMAMYNSICSILSYSIHFNLFRTVRENIVLSFLSFYFPIFILPLLTIIIFSTWENVLAGLFITLLAMPFVISQTYYFIQFRKRLKLGELMDDFYEEVFTSNYNE